MKYPKRPVEIAACRVEFAHLSLTHDWNSLPSWLQDAYEQGAVLFLNHPARIEIKTLEGIMTADMGDWIIRGVKGEIYPCKPDIHGCIRVDLRGIDE